MKKIISIYFIPVLFLIIVTVDLFGQVPIVLKLNSAYSGTNVFEASHNITLDAGFSYTPSGGTMTAEIVTSTNGSISSTQSEPSTRIISTDYSPGTIPGAVNVTATGTATYTIPVELPQGIADFTPSISLVYSNLSLDGVVGKGWNVDGFSSITRTGKLVYYDTGCGGVNFDENDRFMLDGQRLILLSGTYGSTGSEYRLEQNQSVKIIYTKSGSVDKFTVKTKDGSTCEYGSTTNSKVEGTPDGDILSWYITTITNNYGETINFEYINFNRWAYPSGITYGNTSIEFEYKDRPFNKIDFLAGNEYTLELLLDNIEVSYNNNVIRKYELNYFGVDNAIASAPLLKEIIFYGKSNSRLNSTVFKYELSGDGAPIFSALKSHSVISSKSKIVSGDINGDGQTDFLCIPNADNGATWTQWKAYKSNGNNTFSYLFERDPGVELSELADVFLIDLNADGKDDVVYEKLDNSGSNLTSYFYYMINKGTYFNAPLQFYSVVSDEYTGLIEKLFRSASTFTNNTHHNVSDFNGDGINDLFVCGKDGVWKLFSMQHLTDMSTLATGTISTLTDNLFTGDFNGDGKADIWNVDEDGITIYTFNGSTLTALYSNTYPKITNRYVPGDFNGDGKTDLFVYGDYINYTSIDYANWEVMLSSGKGFVCNYIPQLQPNLKADLTQVADFNGDGCSDLMVTGYSYCEGATFYNSKGRGTTFSSFSVSDAQMVGQKNINFGDFDGNGRYEFIHTAKNSSTEAFYIYNSNGTTQDLLSEISNGLNNHTQITYHSIAESYGSTVYAAGTGASFPLMDFQGPFYVVENIETDNGIGGSTTLSYMYEGAKIHRQGKGFLGFSKVSTTNEATGIITENNYSTDATYYYPQLTSSVVKHATSGNISTTTNVWSEKSFSGSKRFIPYVSYSTTTNNLTSKTSTTIIGAPDDYGNILSQSTAYTDGPTHSTSIVYSVDATNWLIARPCSTNTTMSQSGDDNIVQLITTTYESGKLKPDIIKYFDGSTMKKQINHDYNTNGTLSVFHEYSVELGEKHTYYSYDANGINLTGRTLPDGTMEAYTYYDATGLVHTTTDNWGNVTTYNYDNFGNITSVSQPSGIGILSQTMAWVTSPANARFSVTQTMTDGSQSVVYYDLLGREIRRGTKLFNGTMSYVQTDYNAKGQAYRISEPFTSSATLWNTTSFDNYGRVSGTVPSAGASSSYSYSGGTTTVTSNGRTFTTVTSNAIGWPASKKDPGGTISYLYKADGNVKQINAPGNVSTTMTYDVFGNQLSLNDPSAGNTTYTYYGGGELKTQTTPLGTTTNHYQADGKLDYYTNPEGTYNYSYGTNKLLSSITSPGGVSRSYTYFPNGKVHEISETIEAGQTNKVTFVYDRFGRDSIKTYNDSYAESYVYNNNGYLDQILFNGTVVYDVSTMDVRGNITAASIGGTSASWGYNAYGQLTSSAASGVQGYSYSPNTTTGNMTSRTNSLKSLSETFYYDNLDRLGSVSGSGGSLNIGYDSISNLIYKSDAGSFFYDNGKPYQLSNVIPPANFPEIPQNINYTAFGKISSISEGVNSATFKYNSDKQRVKMSFTANGLGVWTKYYFGSSYEKVIESSATTEYIWIGGSPYTAVAVAKIVNGGTPQVWAIFRDHLGTITHLKNGSTIYEYSFDAWGRRRDKDNWSYTLSGEPVLFANRGFTGHEHLTEFGLINMNGRLYDPLVGRFLSPDNYVQSPDFTQSFNRYGYCLNNPLKYTDPSGDWFLIDDAAEFVIGGTINLLMNADKVDNFWEGLGYFASGGAGAWVAIQSFGLAAPAGAAIASFGNSLLDTDFLTEERNFSLKDIEKGEWETIGKQTVIGIGAGAIGGFAGDKLSNGIINKFGIKTTFWQNATKSMSSMSIGMSLEFYAKSTWIDGNKMYSKEAFSKLGIGFGSGLVVGFANTYLVEKWAKPELENFNGFLSVKKAQVWNNMNNSYNPLITPYPLITPQTPNPVWLPNFNN